MVPALVIVGIATLLGAPVFTALGGAALILFWGHDIPVLPVPLKHYSLTTNDMLPSIPIFTLAGYFLAEGGASQRLVRVFQALVGQFRGGPAIVTALVCAFFHDPGVGCELVSAEPADVRRHPDTSSCLLRAGVGRHSHTALDGIQRSLLFRLHQSRSGCSFRPACR